MTTPIIPPRQAISALEDKERRFYLFAPVSVVIALQAESAARCVDPWRLGGAVIAGWLAAGCPDQIQPRADGGAL